jgi:hypothetical protein
MKVYKDISTFESFAIDAGLTINSPESGFSFSLGYRSGDNLFLPSVSFSGYSGYLFDKNNNLFGGYYSGKQFSIKMYFFKDQGRISYYYDNTLVSNNIPYNAFYPINAIEFNKINDSQASVLIEDLRNSNFYYLYDFNGNSLISLDNIVLKTNS